MARKPTGNPVGRPQKPIDWDEFEKLCAMQCTQEEMAGFFQVHRDTLSDRVVSNYGEEYSTIYKRFAEGGKCSLRRAQFKLAMKNSSMAIWLGKNWLDQKDMSKEEVKDMAGEILNAVKEIEAYRSRMGDASRPCVENEQPVLHQGCSREARFISNELGAAGFI